MERIRLEAKAEEILEWLFSSTFTEFEVNTALVISALDNIEKLSDDLLEDIINEKNIRFAYFYTKDLEVIRESYMDYLLETKNDFEEELEIEKEFKGSDSERTINRIINKIKEIEEAIKEYQFSLAINYKLNKEVMNRINELLEEHHKNFIDLKEDSVLELIKLGIFNNINDLIQAFETEYKLNCMEDDIEDIAIDSFKERFGEEMYNRLKYANYIKDNRIIERFRNDSPEYIVTSKNTFFLDNASTEQYDIMKELSKTNDYTLSKELETYAKEEIKRLLFGKHMLNSELNALIQYLNIEKLEENYKEDKEMEEV